MGEPYNIDLKKPLAHNTGIRVRDVEMTRADEQATKSSEESIILETWPEDMSLNPVPKVNEGFTNPRGLKNPDVQILKEADATIKEGTKLGFKLNGFHNEISSWHVVPHEVVGARVKVVVPLDDYIRMHMRHCLNMRVVMLRSQLLADGDQLPLRLYLNQEIVSKFVLSMESLVIKLKLPGLWEKLWRLCGPKVCIGK
ncbi:uncharacterized protein LOC110879220 [Helianthus annuus]|uniref:uncharacterized protein LOC110879220 n=1 Tax=Helianthus annuus TaxID=4232 RepID=UPI001652EAD2|nr:uncharacterized protein LOC110879220 [Helianthus annuus]